MSSERFGDVQCNAIEGAFELAGQIAILALDGCDQGAGDWMTSMTLPAHVSSRACMAAT